MVDGEGPIGQGHADPTTNFIEREVHEIILPRLFRQFVIGIVPELFGCGGNGAAQEHDPHVVDIPAEQSCNENQRRATEKMTDLRKVLWVIHPGIHTETVRLEL